MGAGKTGGPRGPSGPRVGEEVSRELEAAGRESPGKRPAVRFTESAVDRVTAYVAGSAPALGIGGRPLGRHITVASAGVFTAAARSVETHQGILLRMLDAGYRLRPAPLKSDDLGDVQISRKNNKAFIKSGGDTPVWLFDGKRGGLPQAVGSKAVRLTSGMIVVLGDYQQAMVNIGTGRRYLRGNQVFRVEKVEGTPRLFKFERSEREIPKSWTPEQFLAWSLGHSPGYDVRRHYEEGLAWLAVFEDIHGLKPEETRQIISHILEAALSSSGDGKDSLIKQVNRAFRKFAEEATNLDDEGWDSAQIKSFILESVRQEWQPKEHTAADWVFIPPLSSNIDVLMRWAGFKWEEGMAVMLELMKLDPASVNGEFVSELIFQLEDLGKKVGERTQQPESLGLDEANSSLIGENLGLSPERLRNLLVAYARRGGAQEPLESVKASLVEALEVSLLARERSVSETWELVDSFFNDTYLPMSKMGSYLGLPDATRAEFIAASTVLKPFISLLPLGLEGMMAQTLALGLLQKYESGEGASALQAILGILADSHP